MKNVLLVSLLSGRHPTNNESADFGWLYLKYQK